MLKPPPQRPLLKLEYRFRPERAESFGERKLLIHGADRLGTFAPSSTTSTFFQPPSSLYRRPGPFLPPPNAPASTLFRRGSTIAIMDGGSEFFDQDSETVAFFRSAKIGEIGEPAASQRPGGGEDEEGFDPLLILDNGRGDVYTSERSSGEGGESGEVEGEWRYGHVVVDEALLAEKLESLMEAEGAQQGAEGRDGFAGVARLLERLTPEDLQEICGCAFVEKRELSNEVRCLLERREQVGALGGGSQYFLLAVFQSLAANPILSGVWPPRIGRPQGGCILLAPWWTAAG